MRVLFIDPPFQRFMRFHRYYYPLGLCSMAGVLRDRGHEVTVYDAERLQNGETLSWSAVAGRHSDYLDGLADTTHPVWQEVEGVIRRVQPHLVGMTALSVKAASAIRVAGIAKTVDPAIVTVVGADHPTVFPEQFLKHPDVDLAVRGEGEATIAELVERLDGNARATLDGVAGVSWTNSDGFQHNPEREPIMDLDSLPLPALDTLIGAETYRPLDFGAVMTSRGCPYGCTFCGVCTVWGSRVRYRSVVKVVDELCALNARYGTSYFSFRDASFTLRRQRILDLCRLIDERGLEIHWECLTRADLIDEDLVAAMSRAGCVAIRIGIESGSPQVLEHMGKDVPMDAVRNAARILDDLGDMYWAAYILVGTPHETRQSIQQTMDFVSQVNPPFVTLARFAPIPGTPMYAELAERDMIDPDIDWSMECNQRLSSHYVYSMTEAEFETAMAEVAAFVESHNQRNSERLQRRDYRMK